MTIGEIENNVQNLVKNFSEETFVFDLLLAYGLPKATITRLQKSELNQLDDRGELLSRKNLFFKVSDTESLFSTIDALQEKYSSEKKPPRFIVVTDYKTLLSIDTKTDDTLDIDLLDISKNYSFFLPLAGMEKAQITDENPADVKAAEKMAKLYDEIIQHNEINTQEEIHSLNVFLTRLLFCYFAEDSNIFKDNQFINAIEQHTQNDGSDLDTYISRLFEILDTQDREESLPQYLKAFPYVNGGLFRDRFAVPKFTTKSRRIMIEVGSLDWSEINPDIFGSMMQAVITEEHRGGLGIHYTSVPNIMKVIEPLFLDELYEKFENSKTSKVKLQQLLDRLSNIKIFDPACGSGNFLIIAYKELRTLEIKILKQINRLDNIKQGELFGTEKKKEQLSFLSLSSGIKLTQFYGIELDDFAHEIAILSLWLTEHQMNMKFYEEFGQTSPPLPLPEGGHIVQGNSTRIQWEEVCPKELDDEIYLLGNPPYQGSGKQSQEQKSDMAFVFRDVESYKKLDYISCWFYKGSQYIYNNNSKLAFVSTNSITQGEQVGILWPNIFNMSLEIGFAYQSFKWKNNAKDNAGVSVVIIGLRNISKEKKFIFQDKIRHEVSNINAYLANSDNVFINGLRKSISNLPEMVIGSKASDNGYLTLLENEKNELIANNPHSRMFIKKYLGNKDFMNRNVRYCIWVNEKNKQEAYDIEDLKKRFEKVKQFREASKKVATQKKAKTPYLFDEAKHQNLNSIIVPQTGSEKREYLPIGFMDKDTVISNGLRIVYSQDPYLFGVLSSRIHIVWVKAVAGRMKTDMQYSNTICYNTFPFPNISEKQKEEITDFVFNILDEREKYSEKTLAQLYDPNKMPLGLREAHHQLDLAIEQCYRSKPFANDEERLEYLFKLYEKMIETETK